MSDDLPSNPLDVVGWRVVRRPNKLDGHVTYLQPPAARCRLRLALLFLKIKQIRRGRRHLGGVGPLGWTVKITTGRQSQPARVMTGMRPPSILGKITKKGSGAGCLPPRCRRSRRSMSSMSSRIPLRRIF